MLQVHRVFGVEAAQEGKGKKSERDSRLLDHLLAVVGHRVDVEAPNCSNEVSINRSEFGGHLWSRATAV